MDLAARAGVGRGRGWERPVGELEEGSGGTPARGEGAAPASRSLPSPRLACHLLL
jgi:hypothetical protein